MKPYGWKPRANEYVGRCVEWLERVVAKRLARRRGVREIAHQADVFECRYCGRQVDFLKPYHSDERGLWHWNCGH